MSRVLTGGYQIGPYRTWLIKWPYRTERYLFFGSKDGATGVAKRKQGKWPYAATIREVKIL